MSWIETYRMSEEFFDALPDVENYDEAVKLGKDCKYMVSGGDWFVFINGNQYLPDWGVKKCRCGQPIGDLMSMCPTCERKEENTRVLVRAYPKIGRNAPCPCGSGKKYKKCCIGKEEQ